MIDDGLFSHKPNLECKGKELYRDSQYFILEKSNIRRILLFFVHLFVILSPQNADKMKRL